MDMILDRKSEPFAEECLAFARYHFMQREITIEIRGQDKTGNIIGYASMANKKDMGAFLLSNVLWCLEWLYSIGLCFYSRVLNWEVHE